MTFILDILQKSVGYDIALLTTYNFDIRLFEQAILNSLFANNVRKVSVYVDAEELTKSLQSVRTCQIGRKYMVNPIRINSTFHPKVVLLLGEKKARLVISSANISTPGYTTNNTKLNTVVEKDDLIAIIPPESANGLTDIFSVTLSFTDREEICRCWTFSKEALKKNREKLTDTGTLKDFDINPGSDRFMEDRRRLLEAELMCLPDIVSYREKSAIFDQIKEEAEADEDDEDNTSDFVVDIDIPDEYRAAYRQYQYVERIRGLFNRHFFSMNTGCLLPGGKSKISKSDEGIDPEPQPTIQARMATTEEKSFERFVKRRVRGMLNDQYVAAIGMDHYIALLSVLFEIFYKYNEREKVKDIFQNEYVAQTRAELMIRTLAKDRTKEIKKFDETSAVLLEQCYKVIFDNYIYRIKAEDTEEQYRYDQINKKLLMQMHGVYGIRDCFKDDVAVVFTENSNSMNLQQVNVSMLVTYIDRLFGYMVLSDEF